jgi:S-adenosylmethionine decarboxylase
MLETNFVGKHVTLDCTVSDGLFKISSKATVYDFLVDLTKRLDMTMVVPPIVLEFPHANETEKFAIKLKKANVNHPLIDEFFIHLERKRKQEAGVSGTIIWAESHSAFHSWPDRLFFSLDIYSCIDFDSDKAIKYVTDLFGVNYASIVILKRFIGQPAEVETLEFKTDV